MELPPSLAALIAAQDGLLHRSQAYDAGLSRAGLRWRAERGLWRAVLPLVYATFVGPLTTRQRLLAATLYAGRDAQLTGAAALRVHGLSRCPVDGFVRVLVPHRRQAAAAGWVRLHRTRRLDDRVQHVDQLPLAPVPRAALDAARICGSEPQIRAMLNEVTHRGLATLDRLYTELETGPRQHTALARRAIDDLAAARRPAPASETRNLFAGSDVLPPMLWSPSLCTETGRRLPGPDGWIAEVDLGVEIDPATPCPTVGGWNATAQRHAELARQGAAVLRFSAAELRADPESVKRTVERAYLDRLRRGVRGTLTVVARGP